MRWLILIFTLGIIVRLLLVNIPGFGVDVGDFSGWATQLQKLGVSLYRFSSSDYPPGSLYILDLLGHLKVWLGLSTSSFMVLLKYPSILAELILSVLIFKNFRNNLLVATLFLNPAFFFNSAIWGQYDALLTLPVYLSVYFLSREMLIASSVFLSLSVLIKPQALALAPVFLFFLLRENFKKILYLAIPAILVVLTLSFPFYPNPIQGLSNLFLHQSSEYPYNSLYAFNLWGTQGFWIKDSIKFLFLSWEKWGYLLYSSYILIVGISYLKEKVSLFDLATLCLLAFYFLPSRVHERYLFMGLYFLIITSFRFKNPLLIFLSLTLSLINTLDLYYVYAMNQSLSLIGINKYTSVLSGISTAIFLFVSLIILRKVDFLIKKD